MSDSGDHPVASTSKAESRQSSPASSPKPQRSKKSRKEFAQTLRTAAKGKGRAIDDHPQDQQNHNEARTVADVLPYDGSTHNNRSSTVLPLCQECQLPAYHGHQCPPPSAASEAERQARAARQLKRQMRQKGHRKDSNMVDAEDGQVDDRPPKKKKHKLTKLQKRVLKDAREAGNVTEVHDGLFFIDVAGDASVKGNNDTKDGSPIETKLNTMNGSSQHSAVLDTGDKLVPDYVGNGDDVEIFAIDVAPTTMANSTGQTSGFDRETSSSSSSSGEDVDNEREEGEVDSSSSSAPSVADDEPTDLQLHTANAVATAIAHPATTTNGDVDPSSLGRTMKEELEELGFQEGDDDDDNDDAKKSAMRYWREEESTLSCRRCGEVGHLIRKCPHVQCFTCGKLDSHDTRDCPLTMTCFRCSSRGHHIQDCPVSVDAARQASGQYCDRCSSARHSSSNCPYIWRVYIRSAGAPAPQHAPKMKYACYNCASGEHFGDECPFPRGHPLKHVDRSAFTADENGSRRGPQKTRFGTPNEQNDGLPGHHVKIPRPNIVNGVRQIDSRRTLQRHLEDNDRDQDEQEEDDFVKRIADRSQGSSHGRGKFAQRNRDRQNNKRSYDPFRNSRPQSDIGPERGGYKYSDAELSRKRQKWQNGEDSSRQGSDGRGSRDSSRQTSPGEPRSKRQERIRQNGGSHRQPSPPAHPPSRLLDRIEGAGKSGKSRDTSASVRGTLQNEPLPTNMPMSRPQNQPRYRGSYF